MKFAIATDDGAHIAVHTGRCRYFEIYENINGSLVRVELRANQHTAHARGECHERQQGDPAEAHVHKSHDDLIDLIKDCQYLICRGMGRRLVQDLYTQGIIPVFCAEQSSQIAAEKFVRGDLENEPDRICRH
ncbi:MAG: NifB/NifX family molybdenum-iron cluster-binding protein [bacterium]|jgi:predicted Fe-Mo cluster-binding NifX family protein